MAEGIPGGLQQIYVSHQPTLTAQLVGELVNEALE